MSEVDHIVHRDMLLAFMGHILISLYGEEALEVLSKWNYERIKQRWREIAKFTGRSNPEYFFCLFNDKVHDFKVIRTSKKALEVKIFRCLHTETLKKLNATRIGLKLICIGDKLQLKVLIPKSNSLGQRYL